MKMKHMKVVPALRQNITQVIPYSVAIALGAALAAPATNMAFRIFYAVTPLTTMAIARRRNSGHEHLATVHSLDAWRIDSHSDTTLATGAAAHPLAL
jgi:hypothetical protein